MDPDHLERRCPHLGGEVDFGYCKVCGKDKMPCFRVFDCWWERFDVVAHMKACLSADRFDALCSSRPQPKVTCLLEVLREARKRVLQE